MNISEYDKCPACGKKCKNMMEAIGGNLIRTQTGEVVCIKCGCVFVPKSWLPDIIKKAQSPIIQL